VFEPDRDNVGLCDAKYKRLEIGVFDPDRDCEGDSNGKGEYVFVSDDVTVGEAS
jgi:hypothetical protein